MNRRLTWLCLAREDMVHDSDCAWSDPDGERWQVKVDVTTGIAFTYCSGHGSGEPWHIEDSDVRGVL